MLTSKLPAQEVNEQSVLFSIDCYPSPSQRLLPLSHRLITPETHAVPMAFHALLLKRHMLFKKMGMTQGDGTYLEGDLALEGTGEDWKLDVEWHMVNC